jgi:hypothetical protein
LALPRRVRGVALVGYWISGSPYRVRKQPMLQPKHSDDAEPMEISPIPSGMMQSPCLRARCGLPELSMTDRDGSGEARSIERALQAPTVTFCVYRFLVCADKFQTGYDEPLLHTMYVDKQLAGVKAVQTLSRLNRAHPKKHDVFVLDFMNDAETIQAAFAPYYRTTILAEETDPNKLHDLKAALDNYQVYGPEQRDQLVCREISKAETTDSPLGLNPSPVDDRERRRC